MNRKGLALLVTIAALLKVSHETTYPQFHVKP